MQSLTQIQISFQQIVLTYRKLQNVLNVKSGIWKFLSQASFSFDGVWESESPYAIH